jgi:hypothetical protein
VGAIGVFRWNNVKGGRRGVDVGDLACDGIFESVLHGGVRITCLFLFLYSILCSSRMFGSFSFWMFTCFMGVWVFWSPAGEIPIFFFFSRIKSYITNLVRNVVTSVPPIVKKVRLW